MEDENGDFVSSKITPQEEKIQRLEIALEGVSSELMRSQEFYLRKVFLLRSYLKCLLADLEHLPNKRRYQNSKNKITLEEIKAEAKKLA